MIRKIGEHNNATDISGTFIQLDCLNLGSLQGSPVNKKTWARYGNGACLKDFIEIKFNNDCYINYKDNTRIK